MRNASKRTLHEDNERQKLIDEVHEPSVDRLSASELMARPGEAMPSVLLRLPCNQCSGPTVIRRSC